MTVKSILTSLVLGSFLVGCSSYSPVANEHRDLHLSQNFWVGQAVNADGPQERDHTGVCTKGGSPLTSAKEAATPINALLKVVTLGIYSPPQNRELCP